MMVTSFFPGRIRLREAVFKDSVIVQECTKILKCSDAVKNISSNCNTGSILLEYDPEKVPVDKLKPLVPFFTELEKLARNYDSSKRTVIMSKLRELESITGSWQVGKD